MDKLNLPEYQHNIKSENGQLFIFDFVRKRFLHLTPEEWVRQNFLHYMVEEKKFAVSLISVEHSLKLNSMNRRADIVAFDLKGRPQLIVECKAASVKITQEVFEQIARYNICLQVPYLVVTNGLTHYCCHINLEDKKYTFLQEMPSFREIMSK